MNRLTDFFVSFGVALLLHGLLVLGAVWFWTLRPPELRPVFQGGDVSLAVTFVAAATDGSQPAHRSLGEGGTTDPPAPKRYGGQATVDSDSLTDPEPEISDKESVVVRPKPVVAPDSAAAPLPEEMEDQEMLDAEPAAPVSAKASTNAPEDGNLTADSRRQTTAGKGEIEDRKTDSAAEPSSAASRQGVSSAVRRKSEIRPYYPLGARLRGEEGAVTVRVWVKPSGRVSRSEVIRSSGFPALDEAAVDAARRARYVSTQPGAWRAEAETTLTFRFRLTE